MRDSFLVNGVAFKKTFSYAGFEQQPKKFLNPKILLLNIELELKSEKENAEIRYVASFKRVYCMCSPSVLMILFVSPLSTDYQTLCSTNQLLMLNGTLFMTSWTSVFKVAQK